MKLIYPKPIRFAPWALFRQRPGQRYQMTADGIACDMTKDSLLPHINHIEMTGFGASSIISYRIDRNRRLKLYRFCAFPEIRVIPNDTRGGLTYRFEGVDLKFDYPVKTERVEFDGILTFESQNEWADVRQSLCPAYDQKALMEEIVVSNRSDQSRSFVLRNSRPRHAVCGCYTVDSAPRFLHTAVFCDGSAIREKAREIKIAANESKRITVIYSAEKMTFDEAGRQIGERKAFLTASGKRLQIRTPDPVINRQLDFCKLRASESIFHTKNGLMHCPGGGGFYGAIWTNDQCEYVNPLFAYLGYDKALEQACNSYRLFANYASETKAIPTSIIACGDDVWNGAGDRGDSSMFLCGLTRYLLTTGSREQALAFLPSIEKAAKYVISKITSDGIVKSDSDELENRFESGKANLSTSCITYDAFVSLGYLYRDLGDDSAYHAYIERAGRLKEAIDRYFGANVEGFETYRYCEEEPRLRSWICLPLAVGINGRKEQTVKALLSGQLRKGNSILTRSGQRTYWDRSTLFALRGLFCAGEADKALELLESYTRERLLGEHAPYPVEAYPEGNAAQLSGESALYLRVFTEGVLGYRPTGLHSFELRPSLPAKWDQLQIRRMALCGRDVDLLLRREGGFYRIQINDMQLKLALGQKYDFDFEKMKEESTNTAQTESE